MNYKQLKMRQQKEVNAFPMEFAFSDKQFEEVRKKLGPGKLISIEGTGGFIRAEDKNSLRDMWGRHKQEMKDFLSGDENLTDALRYELGNHEFCITGDPSEACHTLGIDPYNLSDREKTCLKKAMEEENDNTCGC